MATKIIERLYNTDPELTYKPDLVKYETVHLPKITSYREELASKFPQETVLKPGLLADKGIEIPLDFESSVFKDGPKLAKASGFFTDRELEILELKAIEIIERIAAGEQTALETITAFIKQAAIAQQVTNCAMDFFPEEAFERARELDKYFAETGKTVGPMHGLPVSVKEHYAFKGKVTSCGFVSKLNDVEEIDAYITDLFKKTGAVYYIRTTQPQTIMHLDSFNNIIGLCRNPYNTALSPGGSSSGEAALVGMRGSPLGCGSDIGGSIRCPAAFCNIWGLKPTARRLSCLGSRSQFTKHSNEMILPTFGPMANSADDLELFMKVCSDSKPWLYDNYVLRMPWIKDVKFAIGDLKIAIVLDDGVVKPSPPILRALLLAKKALESAGVGKIIEWESFKTVEALEICYNAYTKDGNFNARAVLGASGEPLAPLTEHYMRFGTGDKKLSNLEIMECENRRDVLRQEFQLKMNERDIDFILTPAYFAPAGIPHKIKYWGYTAVYNILDLPGVSFPTGIKVNKSIDKKDVNYQPRNDMEEYEYPMYDEEVYDGMPIGLMLQGRRYHDEETLAAAKLIQEVISKASRT
ncbi:uncharacterized protein KNAG_0B06280 [Huiozyma naganishii CBS 8797]|uniref:amidase n=1 Tax=Huiozyma naganishii (strain ATCC MYA-139 / BCRC 22969 / CBS 8797 / KCTC 17520 / NBRC 10181 / NCYC 3082 / Yp74L-3) TaxID=1071383 RepID=J7RVT6_HUIN7|nr:hypothetical protein KNAG_0B06280 [Kazachstania naganishii CBS 8797]CCK69057.1 hypothetical protein KNAG_0B06280 [Kazachstania naganishii CBS 8797]